MDAAKLKRLDCFKRLPEAVRERALGLVEQAEAGDIVLQVAHVQLHYAHLNDYAPSTITLGAGIGGGRFVDEVTLPGECGEAMEVLEDKLNPYPTVPPNCVRDYRKCEKPRPVDLDALEASRRQVTANLVKGAETDVLIKDPGHRAFL